MSTQRLTDDELAVLDALVADKRASAPWARLFREYQDLRSLLATIRDRIGNWDWAGLAADADVPGDYEPALFADVAAIEKAIAEHDKEARS